MKEEYRVIAEAIQKVKKDMIASGKVLPAHVLFIKIQKEIGHSLEELDPQFNIGSFFGICEDLS
jgi:hypothetical protein